MHRTHWWLPVWYWEGTSVLPRLTLHDCAAFSYCLSQLQEGILEGQEWVAVEAPAQQLGEEKDWSQYLSWLGSLRTIDSSSHETQSFFTAEQWTSTRALFKVKPQSECFIFGMALEPLLSLYRSQGIATHGEILTHPPLGLWSTMWFDLTPLEREVYVRMEKAIQWSEDACVHFDGVFALDWHSLFNSIEPYRRSQSKKDMILRFLPRLGQKFVDHGFLRSRVDSVYLGLSPQQSCDLLCQLSDIRIQAKDQKIYEERVLRYFEKKLCAQRQEYIQLLLGGIQSLDHVSSLVESWVKLHPQSWIRTGGTYYSSIALFMEWRIRMLNGHEDPLPEELRESNWVKLCQKNINQEVFTQFERELMQRQNDVTLLLQKYPRRVLPTMSSKATDLASESELSPSSSMASSVKRSLPNTLHLKKLAADELQQLRVRSPKSYDELKQKYISSLSEAKRNLLLDLKQRMQPEVFEMNLKNSLIAFMIENPSIWKSTKASKAQRSVLT